MKRLAALVLAILATTGVARAQGIQGVDVSEFQGTIDWPRVKAAGIAFAFVRVSDGVQHRDPTFAENWAGTRANGIVRGVYQFFRASEDPIAQADLLASSVPLEQGDLIAADVELTDGASAGTIAAHLATWCDEIQRKTGRSPIIYTMPGFWNPLGANFSGHDLWVANWFVSSPGLPAGWSSWKFWQYSDQGSVPGIDARVDRDVWYGSLAELAAYSPQAGASPRSLRGVGSGGDVAPVDTSQPELSRGSVGDAVKRLQQLLLSKGFDPGPLDGVFGPRTLAAVRDFQREGAISVDGVVGPQTWGALDAKGGNAVLGVGSTGPLVGELQQLVRASGADPGPADSSFGPRTKAAVETYQSEHGLAVDGVVGPRTWESLDSQPSSKGLLGALGSASR
jgi:lysozyme